MMIYWCEICNSAPSDGVLEVIRRGETQTTLMQACLWCVEHLDETDWIENAI